MTTQFRLDERELRALGFSNPTISALRDLQRIAGNTSDVLSLEATQAILSTMTSEFRLHANRLERRIGELEAQLHIQRRPEQAKEQIQVTQQPNLTEVLKRLDNLEAIVFGA